MGIQWVTGGSKGLQGDSVLKFKEVTTGYRVLQGVQGVTGGYTDLRGVTRDYRGFAGVTGGIKGIQRYLL